MNFFSINGYDSDVINNIKFGAADGFPLYRSSPPFRKYGNKAVNVVLLESLNSEIQYYKPYDFGEPIEAVRQRLDELLMGIERFLQQTSAVLILNTVTPPTHRLVGRDHLEVLSMAHEINIRFIDLARRERRVALADLAAAVSSVGLDRAINLQNDWVMRMPFTGAAVPAISSEYAKVLRERFVARKKVLVIDAEPDVLCDRSTGGHQGMG